MSVVILISLCREYRSFVFNYPPTMVGLGNYFIIYKIVRQYQILDIKSVIMHRCKYVMVYWYGIAVQCRNRDIIYETVLHVTLLQTDIGLHFYSEFKIYSSKKKHDS